MKYKFNGKKWVEDPDGIYMDSKLKTKLDIVKRMINKNWDCVIMIDGIEGSGKSTLGQLIAYYLTDEELSVDNFCAGSQDAVEKLGTMPDKSVLVMDEGSLLFMAREAMKREQVTLMKIINVIRQKNMVLIIIAPSFFELNKTISVSRSRFLLHVYTDKQLNRGRFAYYSQKKKQVLYSIGKKRFNSYARPKADFVGKFINFQPLGDEYDKVKKKSLMESLTVDKPKTENDLRIEWMTQFILDNENQMTQKQIADLLKISVSSLKRYKKEGLKKGKSP